MRHKIVLQQIYENFFHSCFMNNLKFHKTPIGDSVVFYYSERGNDVGLVSLKSTTFLYNHQIQFLIILNGEKIHQFFDWISYKWVLYNEMKKDFFYARSNFFSVYGFSKKVEVDKEMFDFQSWEDLKKIVS